MSITKTMKKDQRLRKQIRRVILLTNIGRPMSMILFSGSSMMKTVKSNFRKKGSKTRKNMGRIVTKICPLLMSIVKLISLILPSPSHLLFKL